MDRGSVEPRPSGNRRAVVAIINSSEHNVWVACVGCTRVVVTCSIVLPLCLSVDVGLRARMGAAFIVQTCVGQALLLLHPQDQAQHL